MEIKLSQERIDSQKSAAPDGFVEIAIVKMLLAVGFQYKRIAALFDCNQGRIAEIANGQKGQGVEYSFSATSPDPKQAFEWPLDAPQDEETVAELRRRRDELLEANNRYLQRARDAEARLVEAAKILRPFALEADDWSASWPDDTVIGACPLGGNSNNPAKFNVGDLRAARRFIGGAAPVVKLTDAQRWALQKIAEQPNITPAFLGKKMMERPGAKDKCREGDRTYTRQGLGLVGGTMISRLKKAGLVRVRGGTNGQLYTTKVEITALGRSALAVTNGESHG